MLPIIQIKPINNYLVKEQASLAKYSESYEYKMKGHVGLDTLRLCNTSSATLVLLSSNGSDILSFHSKNMGKITLIQVSES